MDPVEQSPPAVESRRRRFRRWLTTGRRSPRIAALVGLIAGLVLAAFAGVFVVAPLALTHRTIWPLENGFGRFAVDLAVNARAGGRHNPRTVDQQTIEQGRNSFIGQCAYCHGPTGNGKNGSLSPSLFPPATDLTRGDAAGKSDSELFWITRNGLSFTAMPGFKDKFNDDAIWAIVAYMRSLQGKTATAAPTPPGVPTPSAAQLAFANPHGDQLARGASIYFAQNCFRCHGAAGNTPGQLGLRNLGDDAELTCQIRYGPNGMPAFDTTKIGDTQMPDLIAFLRTLVTANRAGGSGGQGGPPGGGPPSGGGPPPGGGPPAPDHYSGTANGEEPPCIPRRGGPPGNAPTTGGTPRAAGAATSPTPTR